VDIKKLSINILTWNSAKYIEKCLIHALSQTLREIEIIVIDNDSRDETIKILKTYKNKVKIISNDKNKGFSGGHNIGIKNSNSEYVLILNPDVFLDSFYAEKIVKYLDQNHEYGGGIGKIYRYNERIEKKDLLIDTCGLTILKSRQFIARNFNKSTDKCEISDREIFGVDGMACVYRRSMLENVKIDGEYFDEDFFAYCEDQDLSWRARLLGWKFYFLQEAKGYHARTWEPNILRSRKLIKPEVREMALRNHYLMVIKNDSLISVLKNFIFISFRAIKIFFYILIFEQSSLGALSDIYHNLPSALEKRREIKKKQRVTRQEIEKWFGK
jgi:GT2 family glycosyltransferase